MTHLVFEELRRLNKPSTPSSVLSSLSFAFARILIGVRQVDLNLTATATTARVFPHMIVQLEQGILVWPRTDIKHKAHLWFEILTDPLEKPFMRVDFTIITVLNTKAEMNSSAFKNIIVQTYIPC